jgi:uncharacterized membrane protein
MDMPDEPLSDPTPYDVAPKQEPAPSVPPAPIIEPAPAHSDEDAAVADAVRGRGPAILGYTIFLIPLLLAPKSRFARYHANQALLVFVTGLACVIVLLLGAGVMALLEQYMPAQLRLVLTLVGCLWILIEIAIPVALLALAIMGIVNAANLEKKPLPVIGHFTLIHEEIKPQINADKRG